MTARELPDLINVVSFEDLLSGIWRGWQALMGSTPDRGAVEIVAAHTVFECGRSKDDLHLKACHNFNFGNAKSRDGDGYDYQFFGCGEEVSEETAARLMSASPLVTVVSRYVANGKRMASIHVAPKHSWCRFRAFEDLDAGVMDHLRLLLRQYPEVFESLMRHDPTTYCARLKARRYFTADLGQYTRGVVGTLARVRKVPLNWDALPMLSNVERDRLQSLVAVTGAELHDDWKLDYEA